MCVGGGGGGGRGVSGCVRVCVKYIFSAIVFSVSVLYINTMCVCVCMRACVKYIFSAIVFSVSVQYISTVCVFVCVCVCAFNDVFVKLYLTLCFVLTLLLNVFAYRRLSRFMMMLLFLALSLIDSLFWQYRQSLLAKEAFPHKKNNNLEHKTQTKNNSKKTKHPIISLEFLPH